MGGQFLGRREQKFNSPLFDFDSRLRLSWRLAAHFLRPFIFFKELIDEALNNEVGRGFSPWQRFSEHLSVGPYVAYVIDGIGDLVFVSRLGNWGNDESIYVNASKQVIDLVDGRTYGM